MGTHVHQVLAVVTVLNIRLSEMELNIAQVNLKAAKVENMALRSASMNV